MRIEITPADVLRLKALGVSAEPERNIDPAGDDDVIIALNQRCRVYHDALLESVKSEKRAWLEARRWRAWGWFGIMCGLGGILGSLLAAVARRGGW